MNLFIIIFLMNLYYSIAKDYKPVDELVVDNYMGRWYQVYKDLSDMTFQGTGTCSVADYNLNDDNISVLNSQIDKDNSLNQIKGYAYYKEGNSGGELTVHLEGVIKDAPYWIIELGPIYENEYQYSIVSDNLKFTLFVLARNVTEYYILYDDLVQESLENYGFNKKFNKPLIMNQSNCDYTIY
jgi:apolipoprotein D and lipocalin family protein